MKPRSLFGPFAVGDFVVAEPPGWIERRLRVYRNWCSPPIDDAYFDVDYGSFGTILEAREDIDADNLLWYRVLFSLGPGWVLSDNLVSAEEDATR